jgi:UDP-N-acetylmuramate dehydrogenase
LRCNALIENKEYWDIEREVYLKSAARIIMKNNDKVKELALELKDRFTDQIKLNESLKGYTTYKVGGLATALCIPDSLSSLQDMVFLCNQKNIPFYILGGGSNILIHDNGLNQIVIKLDRCCSGLSHQETRVHVGAGIQVSDLVKYCEIHNLAGLDFMSGIPGSVGGALRMNAGAFVGEIGDRVTLIEAMSLDGKFLEIPGENAGFGYRKAENLQDKILLGCHLNLKKGERSDLEKSREDFLEKRSDRQPLDYGSCGSVFKRPPGNYAGTLIENAGCKGMQIGGAMVSPKHANFIVNYKDAKAIDIFQLIQKVQTVVYQKFKIWLELEVKLVGFSAEEEQSVKNPKS